MLLWPMVASNGRAAWAAVEAQHLPPTGILEGLQLSPLCLRGGPVLRCTVHVRRQHEGLVDSSLGPAY